MLKKYSLLACFLICIIFVFYRFNSVNYKQNDKPFMVTSWDALGYYLYLPSIIIYKDYKELKWFEAIEKKYEMTGGKLYQANIHKKSGNYVYKYLGGVAVLQLPFFLLAHWLAPKLGYAADGFSSPYQFAIALGALFYFMLALLLLRKILLRFFTEKVTTLTLLSMMLASNLLQYVAVDGAMSHGYIFPLYVIIVFLTIHWHEKPSFLSAMLIGLTIGVASISRPTELIMLFIPLLWQTQTKESEAAKWTMVKQHRTHWVAAILGGLLGILPQIIYWKSATGSWVYDVGSKWYFLNPFFRVLFGWEVGWFIYTPIAIFFVLGFFFMQSFPFRKSVLVFCLLNIYIIIAWSDWRYGATYSCRALTQSYPIFALSLAAFIAKMENFKVKYAFYVLGIYLIGVNLFQLRQYDTGILHYRDMNRAYYASIYLNPNPSPLDMSLLDNNERLYDEEKYQKKLIFQNDTLLRVSTPANVNTVLFETQLIDNQNNKKENWLKIETTIDLKKQHLWNCFLYSELKSGEKAQWNNIRLLHALSKKGGVNDYAFYVAIPKDFNQPTFKLFLNTECPWDIDVKSIKITSFSSE